MLEFGGVKGNDKLPSPNFHTMRFKQIKESCLYVSDLRQSHAFYHDLLGFELISLVDNRHAFFRVGSSVLLCFIPEVTKNETTLPPHFAYGPQHIAFEVDLADYEDIKNQVRDSGIEIIHEQPWQKGKYESFYFLDPDKHVLEIVPTGMWD